MDETVSAGGTEEFHVWCVRGAPAPPTNSPIHHFVNNGNGTITDTDTGLMWQQGEIASATNWEGALAYAASLTLGSNTDWRVPNIKELQSINDETLVNPSVDTGYFPGATASHYWSSTSQHGTTNGAWYLDCLYGITTYTDKTNDVLLRCVRGGTTNITSSFNAQMVRIPGGSFVMGDHFDYIDPKHYTDEVPLHNVCISPLYMATTLCTMGEYCAYLNAALYQGLIEVRTNTVYAVGGTNIYFYAYTPSNDSLILWTNNTFEVLNSSNRLTRPVTSVRWFGAMAYCNWLSQQGRFKPCYNLDTGDVDFTKNGFRLPTEAEWEYCAHGGLTNPYCMFPWGTNSNPDGTFANWENSGDPFEVAGDYPNTTPVGFYNGALRHQSDYNWPGSQTGYQTSDGSNPFGLYDMAGNVWEWCNDWYENIYYAYCTNNNIVTNPPGPAWTNTVAYGTNLSLYGYADLMPDGQPWRCLRGGTWWNGGDQTNYGYSRVSNRDPGYYLGGGPGDLDSQYTQTGFRVMRPEKLSQTVGLFLNVSNACSGYTLMSPMQGADTYLLNNAGQYVHKWSSQYNPGRADYLMTNGHLMRACAIPQTVISTGGGEGGRLEEHDWPGNLVWVFELNTATNLTHHDFKVLPNGNVLMIASEVKSYADVIAAGFNPALLVSAITTNGGFMLPDYLIEVQPTVKNGTTNGTIVWEWHTWDHLIQNYDSIKNNYGVVSNHVELINANGPGIQIQQFWNHFNGIDYNPQLDQILVSCRNNSEI
jgi:formylglycine-generating enzyme required for sulfatase activity